MFRNLLKERRRRKKRKGTYHIIRLSSFKIRKKVKCAPSSEDLCTTHLLYFYHYRNVLICTILKEINELSDLFSSMSILNQC